MQRRHLPLLVLTFLCAVEVGCAGDPAPIDAGRDAPATDAPLADAPTPALDAPIASDGGRDVCLGVDCGSGHCVEGGGVAQCDCDPGYHAEGMFCRADPCTGEDCPMSVAEWQAAFDERYAAPVDDTQDCEVLARSVSEGPEWDQPHYFLAYCIDGLTSMWRASGDDAYLDRVLALVDDTIDTSVMGADGFRWWPGPPENDGSSYPLWESYYWRQVTTLLRVMHQHPELRAREDYQARYDTLLAFVRRHVWDKWVEDGPGNVYRSRTHMASHWARMGMDLFAITGEDEYLEVFDAISHGTMPGYPSNLREQFVPNADHPSAWTWSQVWGDHPPASIQDTSHAGAIVSFIVEAAYEGVYWTESDVAFLLGTLLQVVWDPAIDGAYHQNVDGTDTGGSITGPYGEPGRLGGRLHEWLHLGRFSREVQDRIETFYIDPARRNVRYFGFQPMGIAALNARILADGRPIY